MANKYVSLDKLALFLTKIKALIPTKLTELTNDGNFVRDNNYVHTDSNYTAVEKTKLQGIESGANKYTLPIATSSTLGGIKIGANINVASDGTISVAGLSWENISGKPTSLSVFTNDKGFITNSVSNLINYYKKTETYSQSEVNALISAIKTIQIVKVSVLPSVGESNKIYLMPNNGSANNSHDEYVWVSETSSYEKIGTTAVDLTGYWKKTDLVEATDSEITGLFA